MHSVKKAILTLNISQILPENTSDEEKTPKQMLCCELFKNTYFAEYQRTTGFEKSVLGSLFNKVAGLTVRKPVAVLERRSITDFSL